MRVDIEHVILRVNMSVLMAFGGKPCVFANMMKMAKTPFSYHTITLESDIIR